MAPKKSPYNSMLTRANQSRDKVLDDTGGVVEQPEVTEFNLSDYGVTFPSPEDYDRFARDFITKSGEKLRIKGPRPQSQQKLFDALNRPISATPETLELPAGYVPRVETLELPEGYVAPPPMKAILYESPQKPLMPEEEALGLDEEELAKPSESRNKLLQAIQQTGVPPPQPEKAGGETISPTQERLNALASILQMTEGDEATRRQAYERTMANAQLGKIMQAINAGLTRTPVPGNVFEPIPAYQPESRLSLLAKASQALRGIQDVTERGAASQQRLASEGMKLWLKENVPDLYSQFEESGALDTMTEAEWKKYYDGFQGEQKGKRTVEQKELDREVRRQGQEQQARQAINSEVSKITKSPTVIGLTSTIPILQGIMEEELLSKVSSGSEVLNKIGLGQATPQEEQMFNAMFERLIAADRQQLFGATLTGNELESYKRMVGAGPNATMATKLKLFSQFVKSLKQKLQVQFAPFFIGQDAPDYPYRQQVYENFKATSGNATAENPIFDIVSNMAAGRAAELPQTMEEEAAGVGRRVKQGVKQGIGAIRGALSEEDRIEPMPSQAKPPATGGLSPEKQKRLEELRRKKAQGTLGE